MRKRFNTTGNYFEKEHYIMDDTRRFNAILMIEYGDYFVINRPRQYSKTTMLHALQRYLPQHDYVTKRLPSLEVRIAIRSYNPISQTICPIQRLRENKQ
jgi:hypothetical protein